MIPRWLWLRFGRRWLGRPERPRPLSCEVPGEFFNLTFLFGGANHVRIKLHRVGDSLEVPFGLFSPLPQENLLQ